MRFIYAPRLASFDYIGCHRYFLTICAFGRVKLFVSDDAVRSVVAQLSRTSDAHGFAVIAYCFMPDHCHALVEGGCENADFREFVRAFKQQTGFEWKRRRTVTLWQRGYFEHVLRDEEDTFAVARYIIENPVRARLVASPLDYPYLGSFTTSTRDLLYSVQIERT